MNLVQTNLTAAQLTAIFAQLSVSRHQRLRTLKLSGNDLSFLPTEMLVTGIMSGLKEVQVGGTNLTADQVIGIYTRVAEGKTRSLRRICVKGNNDHSSVPSDLAARANLNKSVWIM